MNLKEIASIFNITPEAMRQFAQKREIEPISAGNWGLELPRAYAQYLRDKVLSQDDPKLAKVIADTKKAEAETRLKELDFSIKQKEYIRAELVFEVLADITKSLTKKVHNLYQQVSEISELEQECALICEQLKSEMQEKSKALEE